MDKLISTAERLLEPEDERCINCNACRLCKKLDGLEWHYFFVCVAFPGKFRTDPMLYIGSWDEARLPHSRCELWRKKEFSPWREENNGRG